jgi:hypothetical protein
MGRRADAKFEATWTMAGQHNLKIVAHAAPPIRAIPGFKQYDLLLDGMSFFDMPRIYELGFKKDTRRSRAVAVSPEQHNFAYKNYRMDEERHYGGNQNRHYEEEPHRFEAPMRRSTMETAMAPAPALTNSPSPSVEMPKDVLSESPRGPDLLQPPTSVPSNVVDEFAPVEARPEPPTFDAVANQILSAYPAAAPAPAPLALANESHTYYQPAPAPAQQQPFYNNYGYGAPTPQMQQQQQIFYHGAPSALVSPDASMVATTGQFFPQPQPLVVDPDVPRPEQPPLVTPTMMQPLEVDELRDSPPPKDEMGRAIQNLVNLNDLNQTVTTPEQIKARKQKEEFGKRHHKSSPAPPATTDWNVGQNASLADIQQHKKSNPVPSKEVMRIHAFDPAAAQAGMMVVYGQQAPPQQQQMMQGGYMMGGIPANNGFGAGMYNGYQYHHQQQQQHQPLRAAY